MEKRWGGLSALLDFCPVPGALPQAGMDRAVGAGASTSSRILGRDDADRPRPPLGGDAAGEKRRRCAHGALPKLPKPGFGSFGSGRNSVLSGRRGLRRLRRALGGEQAARTTNENALAGVTKLTARFCRFCQCDCRRRNRKPPQYQRFPWLPLDKFVPRILLLKRRSSVPLGESVGFS
jgi:hypothetical protein